MWNTEADVIQDWLLRETEPIDLIMYWGQLTQVYKDLEFLDAIDDATRIKAFKDVVREMNRLFTRVRNKLTSTTDLQDCIDYLTSQFHPGAIQDVREPKDIVFQTLKQSWIKQQVYQLSTIKDNMFSEEE